MWTTAIELAQTLGLAIEVTSEELDLLEHRGRIEVERRSAESNELKARITTAGRAQLAARNKAQPRLAVPANPVRYRIVRKIRDSARFGC